MSNLERPRWSPRQEGTPAESRSGGDERTTRVGTSPPPSIAVVVPVLSRPQNAAPLAASLAAATTVPHRLVWVCTYGDDDQVRACLEAGGTVLYTVPNERADFAKKIRLGYRFSDEPWLFQAADDVRFQPGWDVALMECAEQTGALVIGSNDMANPEVKAGRHSTHTLVARSYIDDPGASMDGPGTVFSEAYSHQYVDTELVQLAMARGVWAFCEGARVLHDHPFWVGRDRMDATYRRGLASSVQDARIFQQRRRLWSKVRPVQKSAREP